MPVTYPKSSAVVADTDATAAQYNNLRLDAVEARVVSLTAGEDLTALQCVYVKAADGKAYKAKGDGTSAEQQFFGIVTANASAAATASMICFGYMDGFTALTVGYRYYLGTTYGSFTPVPGDATSGLPAIGIAVSSSTMLIMPWQPTTELQMATNRLIVTGNYALTASFTHASGSATGTGAMTIAANVSGDVAAATFSGTDLASGGRAVTLNPGITTSRTNLYGGKVYPTATTGTLTNFYGLLFANATGTGSVTNIFTFEFESSYLTGGTSHSTPADEIAVKTPGGTKYITLNT